MSYLHSISISIPTPKTVSQEAITITENVALLQEYSEALIRAIAYGPSSLGENVTFNVTFNAIIEKITNLLGLHFENGHDRKLARLARTIEKIATISSKKVSIWESDGKTQTKTEQCLADILLKTMSDNFHSTTSKCKHLDQKTGTCKMGNAFTNPETHEHDFKCDFHLHDSLSVHLVLACIHNGFWAIESYKNENELLMDCLFGLYHDIGKMLCLETYEFKNSLFTGFPAHAEIGSMIFIALFSTEMEGDISKKDYMLVALAILRHMCGYHGNQCDANTYKRGLLMAEPKRVRELLCVNRVGDHFGKLSDYTTEKIDEFLAEQKLFEAQMEQEEKFDLSALLKASISKVGQINPNKIAISLIGRSGAGKTHLVDELMQRFPNMIVSVSRDQCIAQVCTGVDERLESPAYQIMYRIYEAGKSVSAFIRKLATGKPLSKPELKQFADAKATLSSAQTEWNAFIEAYGKPYPKITVYDDSQVLPDISGAVQALYMNRITSALSSDKPIMMMDTVMNLFPMAIHSNVPTMLKNCFRVHIHVQSYVEQTSSSICNTVDAQLQVSGPYGLDTPLHPDGFKKGKKDFSSLSSQLGDSAFPDSVYRPHYVGVVVRTEQGNHGYDQLYDSLRTLTQCFKVPEVTAETKAEESEDQEDIFGVDPATKGMNICQFITHLMERFSGDRSQVKEFLRTLDGDSKMTNFFMNSYLEKGWNKSLPPEDQREFLTKLSKLSEEWKVAGIIDRSFTVDELISDATIRDRMVKSICLYKYNDAVHGARAWQNDWAPEMRGSVLFINPVTGAVKILSYKLPRGPEVLTGLVTKNNLETQDVKNGRTKILGDENRDTCERLCTNQEINMHLSFKADGSLCVLNCYTGSALQIMLPLVQLFGTDYSRLWAEQSMKLSDGNRLILPATQGTVIEEGFMAPYMVTSMLVGSKIATRNKLEKLEKAGMSCVDIWCKYGEIFLAKILQFRFSDDLTEVHTLSFEAICKDRCGLFGDRPHTELACSYDRDRFVFLGMTIADKRFYIPHSVYGRSCHIPFDEPLWWYVTHASQVDAMMDALGMMILGEMTKREFLTLFPPMNEDFDITSDEHVANAVIDFEGWVGMKFPSFTVTDQDHLEVSHALRIPFTIYCKIKSEAYYRAHKFHKVNIAYLAKLAKTAGHIFPLASKVTSICESGAILKRLTTVGAGVIELMVFTPDSPMMTMLQQAFAKTMASVQTRIDNGETVKVPKNPLTGFDKRPYTVQCRMALNIDGFDFSIFDKLYIDAFPEIDLNTPDLSLILRSLTMTLEPWKEGYTDRIAGLTAESSELHGLILACIGTTM